MKNTKRSITNKIIISYLLAAILTAIAFWVIYAQVTSYTELNDIQDANNKKLLMVGEAITNLYESESLGRNITKTGDTSKLKRYHQKIAHISKTITAVAAISEDPTQLVRVDSINILLNQKNENLEELVAVYAKRQKKSSYSQALTELQKVDESFMNLDYAKRFPYLRSHQKAVLIKWLEYSKKDNADKLSNKTVDSLTNSMKKVLNQLDLRDRELRRNIYKKEDALLENDLIISAKLRDFLATIEQKEIKASFDRVAATQSVRTRSSQTIAVVAVLSIMLVIFFLALITKDISKSQQYRQQLERAKTYAESLLKSKEAFLNMVTHDLRSPLNTVLGYSELLSQTILNKKQEHYLSNLKKSSDYTMHLVNDLLDFSKLESGKMGIDRLPFYPDKLLKDAITVCIPIHEDKDIDVQLHTSDDLKTQLVSDPFRIKQILTNLLNNAYKFTPSGQIKIKATLEQNPDLHLYIEIQDSGIGISANQLDTIFNEFSQADLSIEKNYGGSGLGLAITQRIVTLLGGEITVDSTLGSGSCFRVRIPVVAVNDSESLVVDTAIQKTDLPRRRVLLLDDEPAQLRLTQEIVTQLGLNYVSCSLPHEALEKLQLQQYDLVLTDIQMPRISGFEFLKALRKTHPKLPVIALSGRPDIDTDHYLKVGFSGSLRKPYAPKMLAELIATTLNTSINTKTRIETAIETSPNATFSLNELMDFAQGDPDSLQAILEVFYSSTQKNLEEITAASQSNTPRKVAPIAHKMLPMFHQLHAIKIIPMLTQLERAKEDRLYKKKIQSLTNQLCLETQELLLEMRLKFRT